MLINKTEAADRLDHLHFLMFITSPSFLSTLMRFCVYFFSLSSEVTEDEARRFMVKKEPKLE